MTTITLWLIAFWILCVLARPLDWWRALLLGAMLLVFGLVLVVPLGRDFFAMHVVLGWHGAHRCRLRRARGDRHRAHVPIRAEAGADL